MTRLSIKAPAQPPKRDKDSIGGDDDLRANARTWKKRRSQQATAEALMTPARYSWPRPRCARPSPSWSARPSSTSRCRRRNNRHRQAMKNCATLAARGDKCASPGSEGLRKKVPQVNSAVANTHQPRHEVGEDRRGRSEENKRASPPPMRLIMNSLRIVSPVELAASAPTREAGDKLRRKQRHSRGDVCGTHPCPSAISDGRVDERAAAGEHVVHPRPHRCDEEDDEGGHRDFRFAERQIVGEIF